MFGQFNASSYRERWAQLRPALRTVYRIDTRALDAETAYSGHLAVHPAFANVPIRPNETPLRRGRRFARAIRLGVKIAGTCVEAEGLPDDRPDLEARLCWYLHLVDGISLGEVLATMARKHGRAWDYKTLRQRMWLEPKKNYVGAEAGIVRIVAEIEIKLGAVIWTTLAPVDSSIECEEMI